MPGSFGFMFDIMPVFFIIVFVIVIGSFVGFGVKGLAQWTKNNNSPVLTVAARVAAKRMSVSIRHHAGDHGMHHSSTYYYAAFEVESGDRFELHLPGNEYGLLAEGDTGKLTFQGTRFIKFERGRGQDGI